MENVEATIVVPSAQGGKPASGLIVPVIFGTVLAVLISVCTLGGGFFWLIRSGHLSLTPSVKAETVTKADHPKTKPIPLEALLVNLADEGGRSYLRIAITVLVEDPPPAKGEKPKAEPEAKGKVVSEFETPLRDTALEVLGREKSENLLAVSGKQGLKNDLRQAFAQHVSEVKVTDVLFTEFLVQR